MSRKRGRRGQCYRERALQMRRAAGATIWQGEWHAEGRESDRRKAGRARAVAWEKGKRWGWKERQAFVDHRSRVALRKIVVGED